MEAVLLQIIFALFSFIMSNPNIPQETKDQALQLINDNAVALRQEQVVSTPVQKVIEAPVTLSVTEPIMEEATSTATTTPVTYVFTEQRLDGNGNREFAYKVNPNAGIKFATFEYTMNGETFVTPLQTWDDQPYDWQSAGLPAGTPYTFKVYSSFEEYGKHRSIRGLNLISTVVGTV